MFRRFIYFIEGNQITEISSRKVLRKIKIKKATPFDRKTALEKKLTEKMIALKLTHTHARTHTHTRVLEQDVLLLLSSRHYLFT